MCLDYVSTKLIKNTGKEKTGYKVFHIIDSNTYEAAYNFCRKYEYKINVWYEADKMISHGGYNFGFHLFKTKTAAQKFLNNPSRCWNTQKNFYCVRKIKFKNILRQGIHEGYRAFIAKDIKILYEV